MSNRIFKQNEFSSMYHRYMPPPSQDIIDLILSYMEKKKAKPYEVAVDVGCGTGRYTELLASHFQKVLAFDSSESQINEAKRAGSSKNVQYQVSACENLPVEDESVDLINGALSVNYFDLDTFFQEAIRILKPNGCVAFYTIKADFKLEYGNCSETLTDFFNQVWNACFKYADKSMEHVLDDFQEIFKALPLSDKTWTTNIPQTVPITLQDLMGFFRSLYMSHIYADQDPCGAKEFHIRNEKRFQEILGADFEKAVMKLHLKHCCVLGCKSSE
ncbi:putative methyltransferase DDB_G0268948 [Bombina bombina]|uniref:putative methyltransferase DDB_G0268948 n=1 Tax=Bombina bombina TaxID=8345 RepID=UPI00235A53B6|nr:putative methyltransferase DDB_G0268948 [Bombina bombina]XP_053554792.1 putative methyltransferase DDB_G0268948 [Bombina bombina]XP_053554793.1 putative methyltransferase DDB_G0268948 [Bombina bombina]